MAESDCCGAGFDARLPNEPNPPVDLGAAVDDDDDGDADPNDDGDDLRDENPLENDFDPPDDREALDDFDDDGDDENAAASYATDSISDTASVQRRNAGNIFARDFDMVRFVLKKLE